MTRHDSGPSGWSELGVVALLGGGLGLAVVASGATVLQALGAVGFGGTMLAVALLWRWTLQLRERTLSRGQRLIGLAMFIGWLAVLGALVCWYVADRERRTMRAAPQSGVEGWEGFEVPSGDGG